MNRHSVGRRKRGERGQSLAEFALVAPIFFLLVFSVIQLGLVFGTQNGLVNGAREAARRAATYRINEQSFDATVWGSICATIEEEVFQLGDRTIPGYARNSLTPTVAYEWIANPEAGDYSLVASVTASYDHPLYVPFVAAFLDRADGVADGVLTLTATEQMRIENPALQPSSDPPGAPPACP